MARKKADFGTISFCVIGAAEWWFMSLAPSTTSFIIAAILLAYLFLAFCVAAVLLPEPGAQQRSESFVPLSQSETYKPRALTL